MALKADRHEETTDISYFYTVGTATRGGVVCLDAAAASGAAMDQGFNQVRYIAAGATSVPIGILLNDVVNKDLTRMPLNRYKDEVPVGSKVTVMTQGYVVTNNITGNPVPGQVAYADFVTAGNISASAFNAAASGNHAIGRFMTARDADGYAKVRVNLPNFGYAN